MERRKIALALLGLAVIATLVACASPNKVAEHATTVVLDDPLYRFTAPEGWAKTDSKTDTIERIDTYADGDGRFFKVHIFTEGKPFGSDYRSDTTWELSFTGDRKGYTVAKKDPTCTPSVDTPDCTAGDGKLQVYSLVRSNGNVFTGGHAFQFEFGHKTSESTDPAVFESMITSFRVK